MLVQTLCKNEAANRPCTRIVLVCCTALVTGGLSAEGLFQQEASEDLVHFLFGAFEEGQSLSPTAVHTTPAASFYPCGPRTWWHITESMMKSIT